jgi:tRNA(fMet)-specific endonuclease VapC
MILLDTDHFSVLTDGRHTRHSPLVARLHSATESVAIPVISVEEQLRAWLAQIHRIRDVHQQVYPYQRLIRLFETLGEWEIVGWSEAAADAFSRMRALRVRIGTQDLKIASMALANDALLLSANLRDFVRVPGLRVEDWLDGE